MIETPRPSEGQSAGNDQGREVVESAIPTGMSVAGFFTFLLLLAGLIVADLLIFRSAQREGLRMPGDPPGNLMAIPAMLLAFASAIMLFRVCRRWGRADVSLTLVGLVVLLGLQAGALSFSGKTEGNIRAACYFGRERADLRAIGQALEMYQARHGAYPATLERLVPDELSEIAPSAFNRRLAPNYVKIVDRPTSASVSWMVWYPGPDKGYGIQDGAELRAALRESPPGRIAPWILDRTYDPTNGSSYQGIATHGDVCRVGP